MAQFGIGQSAKRLEDARLLTGAGKYIADINLDGQLHGHVVRSFHAAAAIIGIDAEAARGMPGVVGVFTAADIGDDLGTTSIRIKRNRPDGSPMFWREQPALATGRVHYVGQPVAFVVAETPAQARDAAEAVFVDYDSGEPVIGIREALRGDSPRVWPECPDNISNTHVFGDPQATDALFAAAPLTLKRSYTVSRVHAQFMEPRGALASYDAADGSYTLYCDVQSPHGVRDDLAANVLRIDPSKLRVLAYDIGGAFGAKAQSIEHRLVLWAARKLGRPVKWQADRSETILADEHGRDNVHDVELALDTSGNFLALRAHWIANVGAYINGDRNYQINSINVSSMTGVYRFPNACTRYTCVMTNTGCTAPYRGAGRPEAIFVLERIIDDAAREFGFDRIALRRRNMLRPDELPCTTPLGFNYDCGEFERCMDQTLERAEWASYPQRKAASEAKGLLRGIGIANPIERAGGPAPEYARASLDADGHLTVSVGTKNHGQGHETMYLQILGSEIGFSPADVTIVDGDTGKVAKGVGTFGSRSAMTGGTAVKLAAGALVERARGIAAGLLGVAPEAVVYEGFRFGAEGQPGHTLKELARAYHADPANAGAPLAEEVTWAAPDNTFPYGTHVCEVEIDPETGITEIVKYTVFDDVGTPINPLLIKGQVYGGIVQGAGQILLENMIYDESGQCLTASFTDYAMPRAQHFCHFDVSTFVTVTERNPLGVKGAGEAGAVGAMAAVANAIVDALAPLGVKDFDMPATPARIWETIQSAQAAEAESL